MSLRPGKHEAGGYQASDGDEKIENECRPTRQLIIDFVRLSYIASRAIGSLQARLRPAVTTLKDIGVVIASAVSQIVPILCPQIRNCEYNGKTCDPIPRKPIPSRN